MSPTRGWFKRRSPFEPLRGQGVRPCGSPFSSRITTRRFREAGSRSGTRRGLPLWPWRSSFHRPHGREGRCVSAVARTRRSSQAEPAMAATCGADLQNQAFAAFDQSFLSETAHASEQARPLPRDRSGTRCRAMMRLSSNLQANFRETAWNGWGTWIRTKTNGVRVRCSTIKLSPTEAAHASDRSGACPNGRGLDQRLWWR